MCTNVISEFGTPPTFVISDTAVKILKGKCINNVYGVASWENT